MVQVRGDGGLDKVEWQWEMDKSGQIQESLKEELIGLGERLTIGEGGRAEDNEGIFQPITKWQPRNPRRGPALEGIALGSLVMNILRPLVTSE